MSQEKNKQGFLKMQGKKSSYLFGGDQWMLHGKRNHIWDESSKMRILMGRHGQEPLQVDEIV